MNWLFPFSSGEKGRKRERSPSPEEREVEEEDQEEESGDESVEVAPASPVKSRNPANAASAMSPNGKATARTPNTEHMVAQLNKYRSLSIFEERSTLAQKLAQAVPDADINSPRVIIVGGQTAGKTKLIISMVFYHLVDSPYLTDDMGEQLLKIFRTGTRMVTRRPTTIIFSKSTECKITLHLSGTTAVYPSHEFSAIIDQIIHQSKDVDGHAYEEELRVYISAPGLPNQSFTDLPGLTTKDKQLRGSVDKSIASMVKSYMSDENSTVVVVEPATSAEDFETSQISPIMRDISKRDRRDIFENSVLVLSKCDKIRDSLEYEVMEKIDLTSHQFKEFPYRHVVGVINKIEGNEDSEDMSFQEFKHMFRETKEYERQRFSEFLNRDGTPCNPTTQCTTSAVFNKMEQISFNMVYRSIQDGVASIDQKIIEVERRITAELAPPLAFYDYPDHLSSASAAAAASTDAMNTSLGSEADIELEPLPSVSDHLGSKGFSRMTFIEEFQFNLDRLLCKEYEQLVSFEDEANKIIFIDDNLDGWPEHKSQSLSVSKHQKRALDYVKKLFHKFVTEDIREATETVLRNTESGCLSKAASPFHRIDRFPALCERIKGFFSHNKLKGCMDQAMKAISEHISFVWTHVVPSGMSKAQLCTLFDTLHHIAIRTMHEKMSSVLLPKNCFGLADNLFVESEPFASLRRELQHRPFQLLKQKDVLHKCSHVTSNDQLREVLEQHLASLRPSAGPDGADEGSSSSSSAARRVTGEEEAAHWLAFWITAADDASKKAKAAEAQQEQEKKERDHMVSQISEASHVDTSMPTEDDLFIAAADRAEEEFLSQSQPGSPPARSYSSAASSSVPPYQQYQTPSGARQGEGYRAEGPTFADLAASARHGSSSSSSNGHGASPSRPSQASSATPSKRIKTENDQNLVYSVASRVGTALFGTSASSFTTVPFSTPITSNAATASSQSRTPAAEAVVDLTD